MGITYKPTEGRTPDWQYIDRLGRIRKNGTLTGNTPHGVGALTCFGTLAPMVFDLQNGVPLITERSCKGFWKKPIAEIIAFINGARTIEEMQAYGCDFWDAYAGEGTKIDLAPNDLGPGSYGAAFHNYETPSGGTLNQFEQLLEQLLHYPDRRTHLVNPWKPYYTAEGPNRKVFVAPCHGWLHFRVIQGKLHMRMDQRSADFPIGVPCNMIQYAALLLMICQVTGYEPGNFVHSFADAHIYENQIPGVDVVLQRGPKIFPTLHLDPKVKSLWDFRIEHFELGEYDPFPAVKIPFAP